MQDKQLIKEPLFTMKRGIYAAPAYIKKHGTPANIDDLKNHNCLIHLCVSPNQEWILGPQKKVYVQGNYISTSGASILQAGLAGLGLIWAADTAIKNEIHAGKLIENSFRKTD